MNSNTKSTRISLTFLVLDLLFATAAFLFVIWYKPASRRVYLPLYIKPFLGFLFLWFTTSVAGHKYKLSNKESFREVLDSIFRVNAVSVSAVFALIYLFERFSYSKMIVFGTIGLTTVFEIIFGWFYILEQEIISSLEQSNKILSKPKYVYPHFSKGKIKLEELPKLREDELSILENLESHFLTEKGELFQFLKVKIPLNRIAKSKSDFVKSFGNIKKIPHQLLIDLHRINDFRRINRHFHQMNKAVGKGGYFVGCVESLEERHRKIAKFPIFISKPMYLFDFIFQRIFPKIPILKEIYFFILKGKDRAISKAETLGRICYCGFQIVSVKEIEKKTYFICRKYSEPKEDENPSYGPLIKLKRVAKNGKRIFVYKFRTMHPYSEYLQDYIHELNNLESGGKFKEDFRITSWGKVFRKLWIDELPQLINLFRGEISLVGIRALSEHYFSLYPPEMQELRTKFKPGLVPPFYADMPKTFEEIIESEREYLLKKMEKPFSTDIKYFFKIWWNIIFKKARSR
ncbi:MAG: hypothetical protein HN952_02985 [Candidatus Cloacimonetes bacterium]|jgi:lipopolysaccharide/colanic/teichoic acid biosynthesis glycosyltransferase|nr:hypothetical protein [Candidatus Cloacimonadota bacterium]MBT6993900.1 hypothetical protein [Candidatus Cloacimonadota bacterium]